MENHGIILRLDGDHALVEVRPPESGCGRCHEAGGCGSNLLNESLRPQKMNLYRLRNTIGALPGERVIIHIPEGAMLRAALLAYLFPALALILGAALGKAFFAYEAASLAGGALGLLMALALLRLRERFQNTTHSPHSSVSPTLRRMRESEEINTRTRPNPCHPSST